MNLSAHPLIHVYHPSSGKIAVTSDATVANVSSDTTATTATTATNFVSKNASQIITLLSPG